MIVTEYMENGSLDAFLRVRAPPALPRGLGASVWVLGDHMRPPNSLRSLDSVDLEKGGEVWGGVLRVSQSNRLSAPHHLKVLHTG